MTVLHTWFDAQSQGAALAVGDWDFLLLKYPQLDVFPLNRTVRQVYLHEDEIAALISGM
jgi:hypothetical protein